MVNDSLEGAWPESIHQLFEAQAKRTPEAIAVSFHDEQLTYHELDCLANQVAHHLQALGVGSEQLIGLCMERSLELVVGFLGILKAGGVYVPLDPTYPSERLTFMLADARISILLTQQRLLATLPEHSAHVICLDTDWEAIAARRATGVVSQVEPENLAYVIYTSGSTGQPKGTLITHLGVYCLAQAQMQLFHNRPGDRILQFSSLSFDASIWEITMALTAGATLCLQDQEALLPSPTFIEMLQEQALTMVTLPPSVLTLLPSAHLPLLRTIIVAGEACPTTLVTRWSSGRQFFNAYGPTEATVCASAALCHNGDTKPTIGPPIPNVQIYLLDAQLQLVPAGTRGELYIGGPGVARGYLQRPELTAERFIPDPFGQKAGQRLYRTGDIARFLPNGELDYLGRLDHQVKLRGFRIEPGEIENRLSQHPDVQEVVVLKTEDDPDQQRLIAYIVLHQDKHPSVSTLKQFVQQTLPEYMVPATFVKLEAFPLTLNGKIDRHALPAAPLERPEITAPFVAPGTPVEEKLANIWSEVLHIEHAGIYDSFFELGGNSLLATQMIARIRVAFQVELPFPVFFVSPTISEIASIIEEHNREMHALQPCFIPRLSRDAQPIPLSFSQERVWFLQKLDPTNMAYNAQATLRFTGALHVPSLEQSLHEIMRRHEIFRTTFPTMNGQPIQHIHPAYAFHLPLIDLSSFPESERETKAQYMLLEEFGKPFNLTQLPLIRWTLIRFDDHHHLLVHVEHHLVHDGWSFTVFLHELQALYRAFSQGEPSPLPDLPIQFADFAYWQREWMQEEEAEHQLAYWKKTLAGCPPLLELPTDHPRPAVQRYEGAALRATLPLALQEALYAFCRQEGTTLFMTLLATFLTLLHRYTEQVDLCIGSGVANRRWRETENVIGMIINTLALRTDLSGNPTFSELLQRVRMVTLEAYAHQDLPFGKIVEVLQPPRSLSYSPFYQVLFSFHDSPMPGLELPGLTIDVEEGLSNKSAKSDLDVVVIPRTEQHVGSHAKAGDAPMTFIWEYNTDLFDEDTIRRMMTHYQMLLEHIVVYPDCRITDLPMLTATEQQLLMEWNTTQHVYPSNACIHELFEAQVERTPETVAVTFEGEQLTYRELNERANQLSYHLQRLCVGPEVPVGVCMERSLEMVVGLLGIHKAGGAYVPLDPDLPTGRLDFMLADAHISLLLTQQQVLEKLGGFAGDVVCLDSSRETMDGESRTNPARRGESENISYVIYTSGSTGQPKGVMITHRALCNEIFWMQRDFPLTNTDRVLQNTPGSFDTSVWEFYAPLLYGARLIMERPGGHRDSRYLARFIAEQEITTLQLVPSMLRTLLEEPAIKTCRSLRHVFCGGEALMVELQELFFTRLDGELHNMYGPTETAIDATCWSCRRGDQRHTVPIGRPIANLQAYVLDPTFQPVPIGVRGDLYIGGASLARGYLHRPELTAERFVPHPFSHEPGARLYKTGDVVRYQPDGNLEFLGRRDHQVKLRGFRVELGEIEATLAEHQEIREAIVLAHEHMPGDMRLVAYVVPHQRQAATTSEWRSYLQERLPLYMVPSIFIVLNALPWLPNGKVNRLALPSPDQSQLAREETYVAPNNSTEKVLAGIWAEILGLERVGIHDNFFASGGHSLLATRVISRVQDAFQIELPLRSLFERPTVAELAGVLLQNPHKRTIIEKKDTQAAPLSFAQQRLWFLDQWAPDNPFYTIVRVFSLSGSLHKGALQRSFNEIVRRHEALRTSFSAIDGLPIQIIAPSLLLPCSTIDLREVPEPEQAVQIQQLIARAAQLSFNLAHGPLIRAYLFQLGREEHILLLALHHIVADGWSMGVFFRELSVLYDTFAAGKPSPLPELSIQYADFAIWQRERLQRETLETLLAYWKQQLLNMPALLNLPTDRPRPARQTFQGARYAFILPEVLVSKLKLLSQREGVTLFMTLLAAFYVLLFRYTWQEDLVVGIPVANRTRSELEDLIGCFVNTLVLRVQLSGDPSFVELLRRVLQVCLGAYAHQDMQFEHLVEALQPERNLSHSPLFQVMFALQNAPGEVLELTGLKLSPREIEGETARFDLMLALEDSEQAFKGVMEYNTDLFDASTIARAVMHYQKLLEGIALNPEQALWTLPLLTEDELQQTLEKWNNTRMPFPQDLCAHHLCDEWVRSSPEAIAVIFESEQLTYRELDQRSNQLAHYLQKLGVGPEILVGLCVERSLEMVIGLLGILKAGGAYVPLDPMYPAERLAFMLTDARVSVLLTQQQLLVKLPASKASIVCLDADWEAIGKEGKENSLSAVTPENLAYVIYTSGSTGRPKGVQIFHRALVNCLHSFRWRPGLTNQDIFLAVTTLSFDIAALELFLPLSAGARVVVTRREMALDEAGLETQLIITGATAMQATPVTWQRLLERPAWICKSLQIFCGGETLSRELANQLLARGDSLWNFYGPTETTIWSSIYEADAQAGPVFIGRPIANTQMYLVDRYLNPVPVGIPGELYIGGNGLARGYLNCPDQTAERFIPNPFSSEAGQRFYKTGDIARWLPDGNIEYLGRNDEQVKLRGFRIELEEIEAVLSQHPSVREARVIVREDVPGDRRLVGYVVTRHAPAPTTSELHSYLREHLPQYMVPSALVFLPELPLTPNRKVDRKALPEPDKTGLKQGSAFVAPRSALEAVVAEIWASVLELEQVGIHDHFFEIGGHSLLATQVVARLRQLLRVELPLQSLFEKPTIAELSALILQDSEQQVRVEKTAQLLVQLVELTEDDAETMLDQKISRKGRIE